MGGYSAIMVTKKSVTKNATFPRTEGLPCLTTRQLHVSQLLGDSFSVSQRPPSRDACSHSSMGLLHEDIFHVGVACDISSVQASKGDTFTEASNMENALMQQPSHMYLKDIL